MVMPSVWVLCCVKVIQILEQIFWVHMVVPIRSVPTFNIVLILIQALRLQMQILYSTFKVQQIHMQSILVPLLQQEYL